ncbi:MAG: hypothetical protein A2X35_04125 [Elusimicrobia bacterium GWA2_61_42]|nr:MAG: hypothetical protein A2X35_04125 [Elusimicrobia bacterium GWA2_61_42]OGR74590.1 MAG: hypothetical protein A2X38_05330 [Elusimicrobia bacterium GWC2_61_25]
MKKATPVKPAFRMTPQRAGILSFLDGNKGHPSAEDVYARLKRKFPGMSFATVYNTLQSLISIGELAEVRIDRSRRRFDPGLNPHSHLMCVRCGHITDLPHRSPALPKGAPRGFKLLSCSVEFYGLCPLCGRAVKKEKKICPKKKQK